jgi:light-regulated signal transduction histidine kinase (bacteriophytochrome)
MADTLAEAYRRIEELERQLAHRDAELAAAGEELDRLAYGVSHDLRSPLRAVGGFAQMLEEDCGAALGENGGRYLGVIRSSAAKLERQIAALLEYARLARQPLQAATVNMTALARRAVEASGAAAASIEVPELPDAGGDPDLLYHVWHNLLANALTYTGRSAAPRIEIGGCRGQGESIWSVRDNGAGFDMRYAQKLFGMFQRMHGDEEFPGTGTGLAIARRILTRHGGRIWAESSPGQGACFHFALPDARGPSSD